MSGLTFLQFGLAGLVLALVVLLALAWHWREDDAPKPGSGR